MGPEPAPETTAHRRKQPENREADVLDQSDEQTPPTLYQGMTA